MAALELRQRHLYPVGGVESSARDLTALAHVDQHREGGVAVRVGQVPLAACMDEAVANLERLAHRQSSETLRRAGCLRTDLGYGRIDEIVATGLQACLSQLPDRVGDLGVGISRDFLAPMAAGSGLRRRAWTNAVRSGPSAAPLESPRVVASQRSRRTGGGAWDRTRRRRCGSQREDHDRDRGQPVRRGPGTRGGSQPDAAGAVEAGLRQVLQEQRARRAPFKLRRASFKGRGLRSELQGQPFDRLRDLADEGRGA